MTLALISLPWPLPVVVPFGGWRIPAHAIADLLSYTLGFRLYLWLQRRQAAHAPRTRSFEERAWLLLGCLCGALLGAKLLAWAESPGLLAGFEAVRRDPAAWAGGKTI
ncbi:MAG TPA: hypothetical protein VIM58_09570, partial [Candidatus Methylacidiphilales bacterium]